MEKDILLRPLGGRILDKTKQLEETRKDEENRYNEYLDKIDELDERSTFYYTWDVEKKNYHKVYYKEDFLREQNEFLEKKKLQFLNYEKEMEQKIKDVEEDKKPWIFEYKEEFIMSSDSESDYSDVFSEEEVEESENISEYDDFTDKYLKY
jgi:hypothetical protein